MDTYRFKGARHAARIDTQVGDRIRKRRTLLGYTQEQLAEALDISYQQIQKYETGANRVSAGRLFQIAQRLEVPVGYFFEGLGLEFDQEITAVGGGNRLTVDLVRHFNQIPDAGVRTALCALVKNMASANEATLSADGMYANHGAGNGGSGNGGGNGSSSGGNGASNGGSHEQDS